MTAAGYLAPLLTFICTFLLVWAVGQSWVEAAPDATR